MKARKSDALEPVTRAERMRDAKLLQELDGACRERPVVLSDSYNAATGKRYKVLKYGPGEYERVEGDVKPISER